MKIRNLLSNSSVLTVAVFSICLWFAAPAGANDLIDALSDFERHDYKSAATKLNRLKANSPDNAEVLFHLAVSQFRSSDYEDAEETAERLLAIEPSHADAHYLLGIIKLGRIGEVSIFRKLGMAKAALAAWEKTITVDPEHVLANYAVFSFYANAPGMAGGDMDKARALVTSIRAMNTAYGSMADGVLASRSEAPDQAEQHFLKAVDLSGGNIAANFALAQFYFRHESFDKVIGVLEDMPIQQRKWYDPDPASLLFMEGSARASIGQTVLAQSRLEAAALADPAPVMKERIEDALNKL